MSDKGLRIVNRVCVYCGSSMGGSSVYGDLANLLGKRLASEEIELVYGGGSVGLMNVIANAVLSHGGKVHGVIPNHLIERAHQKLTGLHITDSMHERKAMMAELSDAFIALPGGFGTFEELLETVTWVQLGLHRKPVIVFNMDGYYDKLIEFIDHAVKNEFIPSGNHDIIRVADNVDECIRLLQSNITVRTIS